MKKIILILFVLPLFSDGQTRSCCRSTSTEKFAQLASNDQFALAHLAPLPLNFIAGKGSMVSIPCDDGIKSEAFEVKSATPATKWLIVFHEWWGLNDYIKREAEKFSDELPGVNIIAVDLYDGKVATTAEQAQEAMGAMKDERCRAIIKGIIKHAGENAKFATIGWCMGGGWSMQASLMLERRAVGCVMYYGMPETDLEKLKKLNCDVLGIFALKDQWINGEVVSSFEKNMIKAEKKLTVKSFDADHAFANPSNPKFNKEASLEANQVALSFLKDKLK